MIANGKVVVTLNRLNDATYANGASSLIVIDPATDQVVQQLSLGGLKNCEGLDYLHDDPHGAGRVRRAVRLERAGAGIGRRRWSTSPRRPTTLTRTISAVAFTTPPVTFAWVIALPSASNGTRAFTTTMGSFSPSAPDCLHQFDFVTGGTMSFGSASPFDSGALGRGNGKPPMPDANAATPRIHVFDVTGSAYQYRTFGLRGRYGQRAAAARDRAGIDGTADERPATSTSTWSRRLALGAVVGAPLALSAALSGRVRAALVGGAWLLRQLGGARRLSQVAPGPGGDERILPGPPRRIASTYLGADELLASLVAPIGSSASRRTPMIPPPRTAMALYPARVARLHADPETVIALAPIWSAWRDSRRPIRCAC